MIYYDSRKVYLEIRPIHSAIGDERVLLDKSELEQFAPIEIWSACGTNQQMSYSTHGAFRFFGKFPPPIATHLINKYTSVGGMVFDPMCGSGTTGVEALLLNRNCLLNDVNPLSTLLSKVKTTYIPEEKLLVAAEELYTKYKPLSVNEYNFEPSHLRNYDHWFLEETVDSLRGIKYLIEQITDEEIRDFFYLCFAGTVRRVSRATTQQGRLFLDVETAEKDALPIFRKRVKVACKGVSALPKDGPKPRILSYDLRGPAPDITKSCADLIICHPPYFNSYKYSSINCLELAWLDIDYSKIRGNEVREFFKVGKADNAQHYISDMVKILINLHPTLKPNACMGLMIGDTTIHGNYIPVTKRILSQLSAYYKFEKIALRAPKYTEAAWVASQRRHASKVGIRLYDFIILMRKI